MKLALGLGILTMLGCIPLYDGDLQGGCDGADSDCAEDLPICDATLQICVDAECRTDAQCRAEAAAQGDCIGDENCPDGQRCADAEHISGNNSGACVIVADDCDAATELTPAAPAGETGAIFEFCGDPAAICDFPRCRR